MTRRKVHSAARPPEDLAGLDLAARRTQRLATVERLGKSRTPLQVVEIADNASKIMEEATATAVIRRPPRPPLACREGCAWCCHRTVGTAAPEVLRIEHFLRQTRT